MDQPEAEDAWLAERFEEHRRRLWAVAYHMLGSLPEADDAVQDAWVRFSRSGADGVENLAGFLTTIVARVCLNALRSRAARPESPVGVSLPDPVIANENGSDPEAQALLADSVGMALMVVLGTLAPAERLVFVLHDVFDVPFDEIAPMVGRSVVAARQLASRARRQVQQAGARASGADLATQRALVDAFFAAARAGDFGGLVALLDPGVVLRADGGAGRPEASAMLHGAADVASRALMFAGIWTQVCPVLVNGTAGAVLTHNGRPIIVMGFTIAGGRITDIDGITDPDRLSRLDLPQPRQLDRKDTTVSDTRAVTAIGTPAAGRYRLDPFRSSIALRTRLFGLEPLPGSMRLAAGEVTVDPAGPRATVTATINAASFYTGNGRRDDDVRSARFLHAEKYPQFIFRADALDRSRDRWSLAGELTVRDVTKPVTLAIESVETTETGFRARATTRIDRSDFGLTTAKWMGGRFFDIEVAVTATAGSGSSA
jgi:RNA polymerase sigma factor (sigma-70 family)